MIIRCRGCDNSLRWDPALQKLKCKYCDSRYEIDSITIPESEKDTMECHIYTCTSCAAKLAVNDVEASTFCAYCGHPTIVYKRVSKIRRPTHIIPFRITREEAEQILRKKLKKGSFVPLSIRYFKPERITGIYIPYRVYNIRYSDNQVISVSYKNNSKNFTCKASTYFAGIAEDASKNFCNESSEFLEPFNFRKQKEFHEAYLSGFYADTYDEKAHTTKVRAMKRCKEMFDAEVIKTLNESGTPRLMHSKPKHEIMREDYVLIPVWFLTLRYRNKPYTMLVNGQNGKVVGSIPTRWFLFVVIFLLLLLLSLLIIPRFYIWLFSREAEGFSVLVFRIALWAIPTLILFSDANDLFKRQKKTPNAPLIKKCLISHQTDRRKHEKFL